MRKKSLDHQHLQMFMVPPPKKCPLKMNCTPKLLFYCTDIPIMKQIMKQIHKAGQDLFVNQTGFQSCTVALLFS